MQTRQPDVGACYLIRLTVNPGDSVNFGSLSRAIRELGGVETEQGYAFSDALERSLALEVLRDRFGCRYVDAVDSAPIGT